MRLNRRIVIIWQDNIFPKIAISRIINQSIDETEMASINGALSLTVHYACSNVVWLFVVHWMLACMMHDHDR